MEEVQTTQLDIQQNTPTQELAVMRGMSPTMLDQQAMAKLHDRLQYPCKKCQGIVYGPSPMCSHCGNGGPPQCLGPRDFHGFPICSDCLQTATPRYAEMEKQHQQNEWMLHLATQSGQMRVLATQVMGASALVGVALCMPLGLDSSGRRSMIADIASAMINQMLQKHGNNTCFVFGQQGICVTSY